MPKLVRDVMTPVGRVITVSESTPITEIAKILFEHGFNGLPVVDEERNLKGLVSERDLIIGGQNIYLPTFLELMQKFEFKGSQEMPEEFRKLSGVTAGEVMKKEPFTVHPDMPIEELAKILAENHINPVAVVELGKLVGIASRADVVKLLVPGILHEKSREQIPTSSAAIETLFKKASVRLEKGYVVVDRLRVRMWWVFLMIAFVIGFFVSIAWIIRVNL